MHELKELELEGEVFDSFLDQAAREEIEKLKENPPKGEPGKDGLGISYVWIDNSGYLHVRNTLGEEVNLGKVVGPQGDPGEDGASYYAAEINNNGELVLHHSVLGANNVGKVVGKQGQGIYYANIVIMTTGNLSQSFQSSLIYLLGGKPVIGDLIIGSNGYMAAVQSVSDSVVQVKSLGVTLRGPAGAKGTAGADGKSAYAYAQEAGYAGTEAEFAAKMALAPHKSSVKMYGAMGDGVTDDTAAVQTALEVERVVYIPGGTYRLTGPLTIRENCELELAQDAVLQFEQTEGNAITLLRSATLRGNHATVFVPYAFTGNVINADTADDDTVLGDFSNLTGDALNAAKAETNNTTVPPFGRWDPQWKMSRYVTDINVCKRNASGFHYSDDGACSGTAVNLHCDATTRPSYKWSYMWGVDMSGVRIAGAFDYGIHAHNTGDHMESWNHDMRIEAVMDGCKIGVMIDNCYYSRFAVTIQPRAAADGTTYAQHGVKIVNSQGIDLSSSRVWDWENGDTSLWTSGGEYQHIALVGNCQGLILDDYLCHKVSDIREHIYTDRVANFDTMTILQEPGNKWFRSKDGEPYFYDGIGETKLMTKAELDAYFAVETVKTFEDVLASATDTDGTVYNVIGYKRGVRFNSLGEGVTLVDSSMYMVTGFISAIPGQTIYGTDLNFSSDSAASYGYAGIVFYNGDRNRVGNMAIGKVISGDNYHIVTGSYTETSDSFSVQLSDSKTMENLNVKYVRFVFPIIGVGDNPMISIDDPIKYNAEGFLRDSVKVKGESVVLTSAGGKAYSLTVSDSGALTAVEIT